VRSGPGSAHRVRALLFDMDGTLVNSIAVVERTWRRFAARHGLDADEILAACHGRRAAETVALFARPGLDVDAETGRLTAEEIADIDGVVAIRGAAELLSALPAGSWAIVTSAGRELAMTRLTATGLIVPEVLVTAEDVADGKPAPDGYLAAARALGVAPADCMVFEDAPAGLQAGRAAGAAVVAVAGAHPPHSSVSGSGPEGWIGDRIEDYNAVEVAAQPDGSLLVRIAPPTMRHL